MIFAEAKILFFFNYLEVYNIKNKLKWQRIKISLDTKNILSTGLSRQSIYLVGHVFGKYSLLLMPKGPNSCL